MRYPRAARRRRSFWVFFFDSYASPRRGDQPRTPSSGFRGSSSPFTMSIGRGAMSGNVRGPSRNVVGRDRWRRTRARRVPGDLAEHVLVRLRASLVRRASPPRTARAATSPRARATARCAAPTPKSCAPMTARRRRSSRRGGGGEPRVHAAQGHAAHAHARLVHVRVDEIERRFVFFARRAAGSAASVVSESSSVVRPSLKRPSLKRPVTNRTARKQSHAPSNRKGRAEPEWPE